MGYFFPLINRYDSTSTCRGCGRPVVVVCVGRLIVLLLWFLVVLLSRGANLLPIKADQTFFFDFDFTIIFVVVVVVVVVVVDVDVDVGVAAIVSASAPKYDDGVGAGTFS